MNLRDRLLVSLATSLSLSPGAPASRRRDAGAPSDKGRGEGERFLSSHFGVVGSDFFPEINVLSGRGMFRRRLVEVGFADITQGDDVFAADAARIGSAAPPGANDRNVQLVIESFGAQKRRGAEKERSCGDDAASEERATG